jgi:uracil-DNA glycosylase family 4
MDELELLHARIRACRMCQDAGYISQAAPVVAGRAGNRIMLVGQAPGQTELTKRRPFAGPAGRVLFGWMQSIGIEEETFRQQVYMTAITKCFPGKARSGSGDRRPSAAEIQLCRPYLEAQLSLIRPETVLLVGGLAIDRYFPKTPLVDLIGRRFERDGVRFIPLPHPSGASRWLNDLDNRELLQQALGLVREEWERIVGMNAPALRAG